MYGIKKREKKEPVITRLKYMFTSQTYMWLFRSVNTSCLVYVHESVKVSILNISMGNWVCTCVNVSSCNSVAPGLMKYLNGR